MATGATPSFLGVPAELFERFAQFAKPKDLLALRLTCKDAAAKVLRTYTEVHFSDRHILLSEETNLRTAIEVAQHPVFGPALKKLWIHVDGVSRCLPPVEPESSAQHSEDAFQQGLTKYRKHEQLSTQQDQFRKSKLDLYLLSILFARLRVQDAKPEVMICEGHHLLRRQKLRLDRMYDDVFLGCDMQSLDQFFMVVMEAIMLSNLAVRDLKATITCRRDFSPSQLGVVAKAFRNIKQLRLTTMALWGDSEEVLERSSAKIARILASTNVEILDFHFQGSKSHTIMTQFFSQRFDQLQDLTLGGAFECDQIGLSELAEFTRRQPALQILRMSRVIVVEPEELFTSEGEAVEEAFKRHTGVSEVKVDVCHIIDKEDSDEEDASEEDSFDEEIDPGEWAYTNYDEEYDVYQDDEDGW